MLLSGCGLPESSNLLVLNLDEWGLKSALDSCIVFVREISVSIRGVVVIIDQAEGGIRTDSQIPFQIWQLRCPDQI